MRQPAVGMVLSFILVYKVREAKNSIRFNGLEDGDPYCFHVAQNLSEWQEKGHAFEQEEGLSTSVSDFKDSFRPCLPHTVTPYPLACYDAYNSSPLGHTFILRCYVHKSYIAVNILITQGR